MKNKKITLNKDTYTVLSPLGKGGQASVWKVRRHRDDKELAMKSVLTAKKDSKGHTEHLTKMMVDNLSKRLQSEIDFIQGLPNTRKSFIVPCLDSGHIEDERYGQLPTWVMPLYQHTLGDKMPPYPKDQPIPVLFSECLKWIEQAAIALEATHSFSTGRTRFAHRDVKSSNLMLTAKDDIRLIDFGIVRETTLDKEMGTHSYSPESAAPEQVLPNSINAGRSTYAIGTHSDMYALGSVFYYLFSGRQSEAQQELGEKDTELQHAQLLADEDSTGLVGLLGGLTDEEYSDLLNQIQFRFDEEYIDPDASIITVTSGMLQNNDYIPDSVADFIRALLNPVYTQRPSAVQMRLWCQSIKAALSPQLSELRLSSTQRKISPNSPIRINLTMIGKGLPANADWVEISVNGETLYTGFKPLAKDKHDFGFVRSEQTNWELEVTAKPQTRFLELQAKALVGNRIVSDTLKLKINETADDLWRRGKHKEALCLELRKEWLEELHQGTNSFASAAAYSELLKSLQTCQPQSHQRDTIALYQQKLEQKFNPNATSSSAPNSASGSASTPTSGRVKSAPKEDINNKNHKVDLDISADDLWQKGKHEQALQKELRDSWLDTLVQSSKTKQDIQQRATLFRSLKTVHPKQKAKLNFTLQLLKEQSEKIANKTTHQVQKEKPASSWKKITAIAILFISITAVAGYFIRGNTTKPIDPIDPIDNSFSQSGSGGFTPDVATMPVNDPNSPNDLTSDPTGDPTGDANPPITEPITPKPSTPTKPVNQFERELAQLKQDLNGKDATARKKAWKRLNELRKTKHSDQANKMIATFVKQTFNLASSGNSGHQQQAFERLNLIAKSGNKEAITSLGKAYYQGKGTEKNWSESWKLLNKTGSKQQKNNLELEANTILHNKSSTQTQRNLAYQAAEVTARNEPSGDPSQKWMVYRYKTGDGVKVDKEKAQFWQDVYDGKRKLTPMIGEQW